MKLLLLPFTLVLTYLSPHSLEASNYWKHRESQGKVNACHSYATIALIEAEYWRETGKYINLSERDLFVRHFAKGSPRSLVRNHLESAVHRKLPHYYAETGHILKDFDLITRYGVASEKELPSRSSFSTNLEASVVALRSQRAKISKEAMRLKSQGRWNRNTAQFIIKKHNQKLNKESAFFQLPQNTPTRLWVKKWISKYRMVKHTPNNIAETKRVILRHLRYHPVAVDIHNYGEITGTRSPALARHSLVVSAYHPSSDQFSIRCSSATPRKVAANTLCKGVYQFYYLNPKQQNQLLSYTHTKPFSW
ncbi:hypothetical protein [Rubritalea marina]|uniref:hypothetical protein n=1 Tax=Rubritalea marina TaxID=361055 RepID=UPI0003648AF6|nr:hypothetical protein [Rubritalea marina]